MPSVQSTAPRSNTRGDSLADILERVLDTGIVIAGDIRVQLADIELLTIQIRLIICSVDKAQQLGMDWWKGASFLSSDAIPEPAKAEEAPALTHEQPASVAAMSQHFQGEPTTVTSAAAQQPQQPQPEPQRPQQTPAWQAPGPAAQRPWSEPAPQQPAPQQPAPQQAPQRAPQQPAPQQPAPQTQQSSSSADAAAIQTEMLNERLARLEAVLERLLPPE